MSYLRIASALILSAFIAACAGTQGSLGVSPSQMNGKHPVPVMTQTHIRFHRFRAEPKRQPFVRSAQSGGMHANDLIGEGGPGTNNPFIYVANTGGSGDRIVVAQPVVGGTLSWVRDVSAQVVSPQAVAVDQWGDLFVANAGSNGSGYITEYLVNAPKTVCTGTPITGLVNPTLLYYDTGTNMLWVGTKGDGGVTTTGALTEYYPPCSNPKNNSLPGATNRGQKAAIFQNTHIVNPQGVAFFGNGTVTIADPGFTAGGAITTWDYTNCSCQLGSAVTTSIHNPQGIAFDPNGMLWVADFYGGDVTSYPLAANILGYTVTDGNIANPVAVADEGPGGHHLYVVEKGSNTISRIDENNGNVLWSYGQDPSIQSQNMLSQANGLVVLPVPGSSNTFVYFVAIAAGNIVEEMDPISVTSKGGWAPPNDPYSLPTVPASRCKNGQCNGGYSFHFSPMSTPAGTSLGVPTAITADVH